MTLSVRTIIPSGAEILRLAALDEVNGIKDQLQLNLASPNDSTVEGSSILRVREKNPHS